MRNNLSTKILIAVLLFGAVAMPALADTHTSKNGTKLWSVAASWNPGGPPGTGDTAIIQSGSTMTLDVNSSQVECVQVDGTLNSGATAYTLDITSGHGDLNVGTTGQLNFTAGACVIHTNALVNSGSLQMGTGALTDYGSLANQLASTMFLMGTGTLTVNGDFTNNQTDGAKVDIDNGPVIFSGTGSSTLLQNSSTTHLRFGDMTISTSGSKVLSWGATGVYLDCNSLTIAANSTFYGSASGNPLVLNVTNAVNVSAASATLGFWQNSSPSLICGSLANSGTFELGTSGGYAGQLAVGGALTNYSGASMTVTAQPAASTNCFAGSVVNSGSLTLRQFHSGGGQFCSKGNWNGSSGTAFDAGTVEVVFAISGNANVALGAGQWFYNLGLDAGSVGNMLTMGANLTIRNLLDVRTGTFDLGQHILTMGTAASAGTITVGGSGVFSAIGSPALAVAAVTSAAPTSTPAAFYTLTVNSTGRIAAQYANFTRLTQIYVTGAAVVDPTNNFSNCTFDDGRPSYAMLKIENTTPISMSLTDFRNTNTTAGYNIEKTIAATGMINVASGTGGLWGEAFDNDGSNPDLIFWGALPTPPGAFELLTPANHATDVAISGTMTWEASSGAATYDVYYDEFTPPTTLRGMVTSPSYSYSGLANSAQYFWQVIARNAGGSTPSTSIFDFTTIMPAPGAFELLTPANHTVDIAVTGTMTWEASGGAASYEVYYDNFTPPTSLRATVSSPSYDYSGLANSTQYYWNVRAVNVGGSTQSNSTFDFITIVAAPGAFGLLTPANHAADVLTAGTMTWEASSGATSYYVYYDIFNPPTTLRSAVSSPSYDYSGLDYTTQYYWQVVAQNLGGSTPSTSTFDFTTAVPPPGAFDLLSPANHATDVAVAGTMSWEASSGATGYEVYYDVFFPPTTLHGTVTGEAYSYWGLAGTTVYYWNIRAINAGGGTLSTSTFDFTTAVAGPGTFDLLTPLNHATDVAVAGTMTWEAATGAVSYNVYYDIFNPPTTLRGTVSSPSYSYTGLANGTLYYWNVVAQNGGGGTLSASTFDFTTISSMTTGWAQQEPLPVGGKNKNVKDGGNLTYWEGTPAGDNAEGYVFAFKGNNRYEFYRYNTTVNTWATMESIPAYNLDGKKKTVKKGSVLVTGNDGKVYASKGNNTVYFWQYDPATGVWTALVPTVPYAGDRVRGLKEGTGAVAVGDNIYLLKGSGTTEFYRYNTVVPGWETMANAPLGPSNKPFKNGSRLAYDGANTIYALKGSYNTLYAYDVANQVWTTKDSVPRIGSTGKKKKVKDGSGMAYADGMLYVLKGGNTNEFFVHNIATSTWATLADMPIISTSPKKVKGGGSLVYADKMNALYAFRGSNTLQFWSYGIGAVLGTTQPKNDIMSGAVAPKLAYGLKVAPNPFTTATTIAYSLPRAGDVSLKLYDVTGTLVTTLAQGYTAEGSYTSHIDATKLARGVYVLKFATEGYETTRKLVIE